MFDLLSSYGSWGSILRERLHPRRNLLNTTKGKHDGATLCMLLFSYTAIGRLAQDTVLHCTLFGVNDLRSLGPGREFRTSLQ